MTIALHKEDSLSVVIIDSGMGGLSICAESVNLLKQRRSFKKVRIVYFNAWPEQNRGYNRLGNDAERVRVFDNVLSTVESLKPDIILIACNTLSILYPKTQFSKESRIPVVGIVEFGVKIVHEHLNRNPEHLAIILGTLTTVNSEVHKKMLVEAGIAQERIISQACDQLATRIESGPESEAVDQMINGFIREAAEKTGNPNSSGYAVLCCTHFGYARNLFSKWLATHFHGDYSIINPNQAMSEYLANLFKEDQVKETQVELSVLSRIVWDEVKIMSIAGVLNEISPQTAEALRNYHQDPELFRI